jgi:hypothetical protein
MRISAKGLANLIGWAVLIGALALCAGALHAIPGNSSTIDSAQRNASPCATAPPRGAAKYTGRIQTVPAGTSFEVNSGKDTAVVTYTESTAICQSGQPVSAGSLTPGLSVTVYGEMNKIGKNYRMAASLILAGGNLSAARTNTNTTVNSAVEIKRRPASDFVGHRQQSKGAGLSRIGNFMRVNDVQRSRHH